MSDEPGDRFEEPLVDGSERIVETAYPTVDELFAGEPPPPPVGAGPRIRRLRRVLMVAIPLDLLGILCWTGVPGAVLTLWVWLCVDGEMARIEAGVYSPEDAARLMRIRTLAAWTLGFCVVSLVVQIWLLSTSFYPALWGLLARLVR